MIYGLIFTIYGVCFMFLLLMTVMLKKNKSTTRSTLYLLLMIFSILLGVFEILSVSILIIDSSLINLFNIVWNIRNVWLFFYLFSFVFYYIELIKPSKYKVFSQYFIKTKFYLIIFIILCLFSIYYLFTITPNNFSTGVMIYFGGKSTLGFLVVGGILSFSVIALTFYYRKSRKNIFQCITLVIVLLICIIPFQMKYNNITLIPFALMFILYIIYYNIENPDIDYIEDVSKLNDDINKSNNAKTEFLFNLSYDLLNPINSIISLCDSISMVNDISCEEIKNDVHNIKFAGNALLDSINNILDMNINDNSSTNKEYSVVELIKRLQSVAETKIGAKNVTFEVNVANNVSSKLIGDINKIQKIFMNILGNAVKFTEVGKIAFSVNFSIEKNMHILHFKISDTGCGIKDVEKSFIFSDKDETSGVGLAISKKYIEEMGGSIRVDSIFGGGTTFFVDIPQMPSGDKKINEDILDIKVTKRLLEKYNVQVEVCESALVFIDKIKSDEFFNLVFLDHKMEELDGVEAIKLIRNLDGYKLPYMVCLTANASSGAREYYKSVGFDDYLAKPIDKNELDRIIKKFCK